MAERVTDRCEALCDEVDRVIEELEDFSDVNPHTNQDIRELEAKLAVAKGESDELLSELQLLSGDAIKAELRGEARRLHDKTDCLRDACRVCHR